MPVIFSGLAFRKTMLASDAPVVIQNRIPRSRPRNPIQVSRAPLRPQARSPPRPSLSPAGLERAVCSLHCRGGSYQRISHRAHHPCPSLLRARLATPLPPTKHPRWPRPNLPADAHVRRRGARRIPWAGPAAGRLGGAPASARATRRAAALQCAIRMLAVPRANRVQRAAHRTRRTARALDTALPRSDAKRN